MSKQGTLRCASGFLGVFFVNMIAAVIQKSRTHQMDCFFGKQLS